MRVTAVRYTSAVTLRLASRMTRIQPRLRVAAIAPWLLTLILLSACGGAAARPTETPTVTPVPATATPAGPTATPTPDLAVLLRDGGISMIEAAYGRLLDEYIDPLEPRALLSQAWDGVRQEAAAEGLSVPPTPTFTSDRDAAFGAFRAAYVPLAAKAEDAKQLRFAAIRQMAASLHDCHTFFLNPVASDTLIGTRAGNGVVGIGINLAGVPPLVTEVIGGGPAERAGVLVGDRITAIDDVDTTTSGPAAAFDRINGQEGTNVQLRLQRPRQNAPVTVTITRERVIPQNVESHVISMNAAGGRIGYVRIRSFVDGGVSAPLRDALTEFEREGVTKWIVDLRGNPGGRLDTEAMSLFVKDGVIVRDRGRGGKTDENRASGNVLPVLRPTVLLVNNGTGSVSEMFAAALQEYGVAYMVGETTNGCAGFTDIQPLGDGSSLAVTTNVNVMPISGKPLHGVGVVPDEAVTRTLTDIAAGRDPQLDAAVAHLSR